VLVDPWEKTFMNQIVATLLIAGLLPIVCAGIAKWRAKDFDNNQPRAWMEEQDDWRARANAAQQNSFEAFPLFAGGVLLALVTGTDPAQIAQTCWVFIAARIAYIYCYVTNQATLRTIVWLVGIGAAIRLYLLAI
jgi:uncharacterized MAPEG superfamily protein